MEGSDRLQITKWTLFVSLLITVPVPFYMFVVGGLIPTVAIIFMTLQGVVVAVPKFKLEGFVILGVLGVHVIVLCGLLYVAAAGLTRFLYWVMPRTVATSLIIFLIAGLFTASCFNIYRLPGHNWTKPANLPEVFKGFVLTR